MKRQSSSTLVEDITGTQLLLGLYSYFLHLLTHMMIKDPFLKGIARLRSRGLVLPIYETNRQRIYLWLPRGMGSGGGMGLGDWDWQMQSIIYRMDKQ